MPLVRAWIGVWIYLGFLVIWAKSSRPRFDSSTDMGLVLVPADAEIDSVIFRLRATDQDVNFPLVFDITATITPVVRIDNLPCTLYNKVCQANVILTKRLIPGRLHDFAVRVRDSKGNSNSMQGTVSVTNATTPRDKIFPHIPSLIMVPEDTKPGKELDYLLVRANPWSGKPVYIELWQPKELFTITQRQTPLQTKGMIVLTGELDFETQSMYTLTMYATDPYTEPGKDTRNIAGLNVVVIVQDVQDMPPIFTLAPPLTKINNSVQPGDVILRVHAEDGDKGVPREIAYGLVSESNPFTPFFNISETTGEITLARPLEELTQITHVGAPIVLTIVAEEIRRFRDEPPTQATVVEVGLLLGEPGNSPPYFESDNYIAMIDENLEPGTVITFADQYSTKVRDEDIGKAGVFALKLDNNNGTFEISPTVAERNADFIITVRDNVLIDYELHTSLTFKIIAQEVGPATNLSTAVPVTIFIRDLNDNPPVFDEDVYEVTLSENITAGTRVVQVRATDEDTGVYGSIQYTKIMGEGSEAFTMDSDTGLITVSMGSSLDREITPKLELTIEARDENGKGNRGVVPFIVNLLDVNDNAPIFEKNDYEFTLNLDLSNFTGPAIIKAIDADAEPPNNMVRYEIMHGNYENKFHLDEITGELILTSPITKVRRKKQSTYDNVTATTEDPTEPKLSRVLQETTISELFRNESDEKILNRRKRENEDPLYTLTVRGYDLGVPHLSTTATIRVVRTPSIGSRIVMFVVPGEHPDPNKTAETLATITGGRVTVQDIRPYTEINRTNDMESRTMPASGNVKRSIVVARVEQNGTDTSLVDLEKVRQVLAASGFGILNNMEAVDGTISSHNIIDTGNSFIVNGSVVRVYDEDVIVYKSKNTLLFWLLILLGLAILLAIAILIICCICPACPFYMEPRKRRVHSSETLIARSNGRPRRHLQRRPPDVEGTWFQTKKQAWSADPSRRNWQFNRRNFKNYGGASLPGDVQISRIHDEQYQKPRRDNIETFKLRDGPMFVYESPRRRQDQDRLYVEDVEGHNARPFDIAELDPLRRHDFRFVESGLNEEKLIREQHYYRDGNAEVLRLITRGPLDDHNQTHEYQHQPRMLVVDGKEILLRRFIDDQKIRPEMPQHDSEALRSLESYRRSREFLNTQQHPQELILLPERLELGQRQHIKDFESSAQTLTMDRNDYDGILKATTKEEEHSRRETQNKTTSEVSITSEKLLKDHQQTPKYFTRDRELTKQNALLTRILMERGTMLDTASYLETQSLPGQVAIATQTDRTTATQTDYQVRSRSDNDESEEDIRQRRKLKSKKRYGEECKKTRTLWTRSPIEEEDSPSFDKRLSILRKKVKEVKESKRTCLKSDVLREISDSLNDEEEIISTKNRKPIKEEPCVRYNVLKEKIISDYDNVGNNESNSSPEVQRKNIEHDDSIQIKSSRVEPSFRILEREITLLTKKLNKLNAKKTHDTHSDEIDQGRLSRKDLKSRRDMDPSNVDSNSRISTKQIDTNDMSSADIATKKSRQKATNIRQVFSTGSSDREDITEKPKSVVKKLQNDKYNKLKRQSHVERMDLKKSKSSTLSGEQDPGNDRKRESSSDGKFFKSGTLLTRAQKLLAVGRKGSDKSDEFSSSSNGGSVCKKDTKNEEIVEIKTEDSTIEKSKILIDFDGMKVMKDDTLSERNDERRKLQKSKRIEESSGKNEDIQLKPESLVTREQEEIEDTVGEFERQENILSDEIVEKKQDIKDVAILLKSSKKFLANEKSDSIDQMEELSGAEYRVKHKIVNEMEHKGNKQVFLELQLQNAEIEERMKLKGNEDQQDPKYERKGIIDQIDMENMEMKLEVEKMMKKPNILEWTQECDDVQANVLPVERQDEEIGAEIGDSAQQDILPEIHLKPQPEKISDELETLDLKHEEVKKKELDGSPEKKITMDYQGVSTFESTEDIEKSDVEEMKVGIVRDHVEAEEKHKDSENIPNVESERGTTPDEIEDRTIELKKGKKLEKMEKFDVGYSGEFDEVQSHLKHGDVREELKGTLEFREIIEQVDIQKQGIEKDVNDVVELELQGEEITDETQLQSEYEGIQENLEEVSDPVSQKGNENEVIQKDLEEFELHEEQKLDEAQLTSKYEGIEHSRESSILEPQKDMKIDEGSVNVESEGEETAEEIKLHLEHDESRKEIVHQESDDFLEDLRKVELQENKTLDEKCSQEQLHVKSDEAQGEIFKTREKVHHECSEDLQKIEFKEKHPLDETQLNSKNDALREEHLTPKEEKIHKHLENIHEIELQKVTPSEIKSHSEDYEFQKEIPTAAEIQEIPKNLEDVPNVHLPEDTFDDIQSHSISDESQMEIPSTIQDVGIHEDLENVSNVEILKEKTSEEIPSDSKHQELHSSLETVLRVESQEEETHDEIKLHPKNDELEKSIPIAMEDEDIHENPTNVSNVELQKQETPDDVKSPSKYDKSQAEISTHIENQEIQQNLEHIPNVVDLQKMPDEKQEALETSNDFEDLQKPVQMIGEDVVSIIESKDQENPPILDLTYIEFPPEQEMYTVSTDPSTSSIDEVQSATTTEPDFTYLTLPSTNVLDDSDESDASSDLSRKTTLTTKPYSTPRNHKPCIISNDEILIDTEPSKIQSSSSVSSFGSIVSDTTKPTGTTSNIESNDGKIIKETKESMIERESISNIETDLEETKEITRKISTCTKEDKDETSMTVVQKITEEYMETMEISEKKPSTRGESKREDDTKEEKDEIKKQEEPVGTQRRKGQKSYEGNADRGKRKQPAPSVKLKTEKDDRGRKQRSPTTTKTSNTKTTKLDKEKKSWSSPKLGGDIDTSKAQSKYMAWYTEKRDEAKRKRFEEKKLQEEEEQNLPRWLRRSLSYRKAVHPSSSEEHTKPSHKTPKTRRKVKPLVNVESEQLKAIVRQGRKLRRAEGCHKEDPLIEIFASSPPICSDPKDYHLVQHSEYKYEKMHPPFWLHPPPVPYPSPQLSPERFDPGLLSSDCSQLDEESDPTMAISLISGGNRRHQQLLEKKSVFDIAYSEAAPSQLRSDSTTPPS